MSDRLSQTPPSRTARASQQSAPDIGRSTALMSGAVVISRITGFIRTWAMAFALGSTFLTSSYSVANNLPNLLFELVCGGVIVTAFLPVYLEVKAQQGTRAANEYASALVTIVAIFTLIISVLGIIFSDQVVLTMMFLTPADNIDLASYFFKFFSIQIACYSIAAITSGLLNAEREYLWPAIAPVFNNLVTIVTMFAFVPLSRIDIELAKVCLAVGTTLGVIVQLLVQIPTVIKRGLRLTLNVKFNNPALKKTVVTGSPIMVITVMMFITVAFETSTALKISDAGPAVIAYARMWWTLPYSFFAVPITTTLFTELSRLHTAGDDDAYNTTMISGLRQQIFFTLPCAALLALLAAPLISLYKSGQFTADDVRVVASYLVMYAPSLPLYAVMMYLNKVFGSLQKMKVAACVYAITGLFYLVLLYALSSWDTPLSHLGLALIPFAYLLSLVADLVITLGYLHKVRATLNLRPIMRTAGISAVVTGVAAAVAYLLLQVTTVFFGSYTDSLLSAFAITALSGFGGLFAGFGGAMALRVDEARYLNRLMSKVARRFARSA